jgi:anthranilate phosphoribosyltransferase
MNFAPILKEVGRGERGARDLTFEEAKKVFGAMLDGGVPDLELGALLIAFRFKTESLAELLGFHAALDERIVQLRAPQASTGARLRPIVIPSYNGARRQANLMPLLVMLLKRMEVPVLVHGVLESDGRVAAAYVFRELGILPQANSRQAQEALQRDGVAFVPIGALAPGLSNLLALRGRLGLRSSAHTLAKLIDPFSADNSFGARQGGGLRMVSVTHPAYADKMREFFIESGSPALLMRGTEGEAFANPKRRPQIEYICDGATKVLFEAEHGSIKNLPALPDECDARTTAQWIRETLDGAHPIPLPIINQLACCLYAAGYTDDFTQAKAIAAVKARLPMAA